MGANFSKSEYRPSWERDASWPQAIRTKHQDAANGDQDHDLPSTYHQTIMFDQVRQWLERQYPESAAAGSILEMGGHEGSDDAAEYPTMVFLISAPPVGDILSLCLAVAAPIPRGYYRRADAESDNHQYNTVEMEKAQEFIRGLLRDQPRPHAWSSPSVTDHTVLHVFLGVDLVTSRLNPTHTRPVIREMPLNVTEQLREIQRSKASQLHQRGSSTGGIFLSTIFQIAVQTQAKAYKRTAVWDGGELPFAVGSQPYPFATRLLISRDCDETTPETNEDGTQFRVLPAPDSSSEYRGDGKPVLLKRATDCRSHCGVIRAINLVVAISDDVVWPLYDDFLCTDAFKAAEAALLDHAKQLNRRGALTRCELKVSMGLDVALYRFIGAKFDTRPFADAEPVLGDYNDDDDDGDDTIDGFHIMLRRVPIMDLSLD